MTDKLRIPQEMAVSLSLFIILVLKRKLFDISLELNKD